MKNFILIILVFLTLTEARSADLASSLIDVNRFWAFESNALQNIGDQDCDLDASEMIQLHLKLVHQELASRDVSHLSAELRQNRKRSLEHLSYYAERGLFPQNLTHSVRTPVFIDHRGVHCAVGYLITASGYPGLSGRISANMNTHYLKDMDDDLLASWVHQSGFTLNELAWIQPGYPVPVNWDAMKGGMNGPVHAIASDSFNGVFAAGFFDTAGGYSASNAAHWYSGFAGFDWMGLHGSGTNGPVHDILVHNKKIYMAGSFSMVDTIYTGSSIVKWNGTRWESFGQFYIGGLLSYVNDLAIYRDTLYAGGFFRSDINAPEFFTNLAKWDGQNWRAAYQDSVFVQGEVKSLHVHQGELIVGGDFQLSDSAQTSNVFKINGQHVGYFQEAMPYAVNDLATYGGELYAAGKYDETKSLKGGLMKYDDSANQWRSRVVFTPNGTPQEVLVLEETPYGLAFGGDFNWDQLLGFFVVNAGLLSDSSNAGNTVITSLGILDSSVTSMHYKDGYLYQGGYFEQGLSTLLGGLQPLGHIAKLEMATIGLREQTYTGIDIYPNPASGYVMVKIADEVVPEEFAMFDVSGRRVECPVERIGKGLLRINTSNLSNGSYTLQLSAMGQSHGHQIIINAN